VSRLFIAAVAWLALATVCFGQDLVTLEGVGPGSYVLTVGADGSVSLRPTRLIRVGSNPLPPSDPQPPLSPFATEVRNQATTVLNSGGSPTTAAAISIVYSRTADRVAADSLPLGSIFTALKDATDAVMALQSDRDKWPGFRTALSDALATLQQQGQLTTKEQYVSALRDISRGVADAAGYTPAVQEMVESKNAEQPFIGGIDIARLLELLNLILTILERFGGAVEDQAIDLNDQRSSPFHIAMTRQGYYWDKNRWVRSGASYHYAIPVLKLPDALAHAQRVTGMKVRQ